MFKRVIIGLLLLTLGMTSVQTALARAEARGAHSIMLCADGGMRLAQISADGEEINPHQACPDCTLIGWALEPVAPLPPRLLGALQQLDPLEVLPLLVKAQLALKGARDPPSA